MIGFSEYCDSLFSEVVLGWIYLKSSFVNTGMTSVVGRRQQLISQDKVH